MAKALSSAWKRKNKALTRTFKCPSFVDAMAFAMKIAFYAESVDHHPDLQISYKTVTVTWTTHDEGGITEKDVAAAKFTDSVAP
jgi:4a-hydroxytetrahydrobiopterin dehydratase